MRFLLPIFVLRLSNAIPALAWDAAQDLLDAARKGDLAAVKTALENQAPVEAKTRYGQTPLFLAAMNGHAEVVRALLDKGAQVDITDSFYKFSMIGFVATRKHAEVLKLLLPKSKDVDANLGAVVRSGNTDMVKLVLEGETKPSQAALNRNLELMGDQSPPVAELLRKAGAQPPAPPVVVEPKILDSYVGSYRSETLPLEIKVSAKEGKLFLQASGQPEFAPKAKSQTLFEFPPAGLQVEFTGPGAFALRQGGQTYQFKKAVAQ